MSLTVPRLIEFIAADLDILREYWRIRKDKKGKISIEDVRTFVNKLDILIEFWQRLQVLNNDGTGGKCMKCLLRKKASPGGKIKHKEASCQTSEESRYDQTVSSSIDGNDDADMEVDHIPDLEEEIAQTVQEKSFENIQDIEVAGTVQEESFENIQHIEKEVAVQEESFHIETVLPDIQEENSRESITTTVVKKEASTTYEFDDPAEAHQIVPIDAEETLEPNIYDITPVPSPNNLDFDLAEELTDVEVKQEPSMVTLHTTQVKSEAAQVDLPTKTSNLEQSIRRLNPSVILDRRLADRVLALSSEGVSFTLREQTEVINQDLSGGKTPRNVPVEEPLTPYMRYSQKVWESVKVQNSRLPISEIAKIVSQMWRNLPESEKQDYGEENHIEKREYDRNMAKRLAHSFTTDDEDTLERRRQYLLDRLSNSMKWKKKRKRKNQHNISKELS